jgi:hypothetical protein
MKGRKLGDWIGKLHGLSIAPGIRINPFVYANAFHYVLVILAGRIILSSYEENSSGVTILEHKEKGINDILRKWRHLFFSLLLIRLRSGFLF